jgi:hypothetical protein
MTEAREVGACPSTSEHRVAHHRSRVQEIRLVPQR